MRYRFYREHKFVIPFINDISRLIAKTDFKKQEEYNKVEKSINGLIELLQGHAEHEEKAFHILLEQKDSQVHKAIEKDHKEHLNIFASWHKQLAEIASTVDAETREELGYKFYLNFRVFEANNLLHLDKEESIIMPELQRLYADDELKAIEAKTYHQMTSTQMVHMLQILFPHMDANDRWVFLQDIHDASPEKFKEAFISILNKNIIADSEAQALLGHFNINPSEFN